MTARWYVIHVYSGFEKKVAQSIREQAEQKGLGEKFEEVLVPTEEVVEVKRGAKVSAERKFFPGYVLVKMDLTDETWHLVKNTPKVTGFLGGKGRPVPISEAEAGRIMRQVQEGIERPKPSITFEIGEQVRVSRRAVHLVQRPVEDVDEEKARLKVAVSIFGRATPVELEYSQVGKGLIGMAKKIVGFIKLQVPAGKANPSPPIGPALGQRGLNIMEFCKTFNAQTQNLEPGMPMPVVITAFADRSFTFITKSPPNSYFLHEGGGDREGLADAGQGHGRQGDDGADARDRAEEDDRSQRQGPRRRVPA